MFSRTISYASTKDNTLRLAEHEIFYVFKPNGKVVLTMREPLTHKWAVGTMPTDQFNQKIKNDGAVTPYSCMFFIRNYTWNNINALGESSPTHEELLMVM